ncbi:MAG: ATP-grasp domain-containing protein [Lentisphaerae bacterium]|nr:ATP-grasp domain-containing protein [Lentisphaerota bacterium]
MLIGITYDLRSEYLARGYTLEQVVEFDCEETIDAIASALVANGHTVVRIGSLPALMQRLLNQERWDLVFNIAEGIGGGAREAQIPALLDAYAIPYTFSPAEILALALDKALTKSVMRAHAVPTADFALIRRLADCAAVKLAFPLFAKPVAEGTSRGVTSKSLLHDQQELEAYCAEYLSRMQQPVLVETYLSGREFTVGMLGNGPQAEVLGVLEVCFTEQAEQQGYTYDNKQLYEGRVEYRVVDEPEVAAVARQAWSALHCCDAGRVDIRMDAQGRPFFLEVNPLAGLNPRYSDLCILCSLLHLPYNWLIGKIVNSAWQRYQERGPASTLRQVAAQVASA